MKRSVQLLGIIASVFVLAISAMAQAAPRQEKLLNGLKVFIWTNNSEKATVRIRVNAGAAFDPQGKEGTMKLLAGAIFPGETAREYFRDDLGGDLSVTVGYDFVQIDASGRSSELLSMLETLANAITDPTIDKEVTEQLKAVLLTEVEAAEKDPGYVADRAVAKALFGTFPYGRPLIGTPQSLKAIDFADLRFAKDRLFTADNAVVTITGPVKSDVVYRGMRRVFGAWSKSDRPVPPTFRQPDDPAAGLSIIASPVPASELRIAIRGVGRSDTDFAAAAVLRGILESRLRNHLKRTDASVFVQHDARLLPGSFVFGISRWAAGEIKKDAEGRIVTPYTDKFLQPILAPEISAAEFDAAKAAFLTGVRTVEPDRMVLDVDLFELGTADKVIKDSSAVTIDDAKRVLVKLRTLPAAAVLVYGE